MNILLVRLDHLGDVLLTTPLIRALARGDHVVDVLVQDALKPLFLESASVRQCFGIGEVAPGFPTRWWQLVRWLRRSSYDVIILAYAKERRLCLASMLSGIGQRIAMWGGLWGRLTLHECLASHILDNPRPVSEILLDCSRKLGLPDQGLKPDLVLTSSERAEIWTLIPAPVRERRIVGIHPGSAGNACNLPSHVYAELGVLLLRQTDCALVITGTGNEERLLIGWPEEVLASDRVWISMGKLELRELAGVIAKMNVFVCSSTGPLHIASAVGTATVSPFCPSTPLNAAIWGNVGAPSRVLEPQTCPRSGGMQTCCDFRGQISAEQLFRQVQELLSVPASANDL